MPPFYSIIIPTCNQASWVKESVLAALNQSFEDIEVIVSDDSDDQQTEAVLATLHDSRLRYMRNVPALGRVKNYRTCVMERAEGKWCLICDGDDIISDKDYLLNVKDVIEANPKVVMIQAGHVKGVSLASGMKEMPGIATDVACLSGYDYLINFNDIAHFSHLSTVSRLDVLKSLTPFRYDIISSDIETYLRLAAHGNVCLIKKSIGLWRQHGSNTSVLANHTLLLKNLSWIDSVHTYWLAKATTDQIKVIRKLKYVRLKNGIFSRLKHLLKDNAAWSQFFLTLKNIFLEKEFCKAIIWERKFYKLCGVYLKQKILYLFYCVEGNKPAPNPERHANNH
jgi:glycosyltransferase involved in cell wall biosynthesis